MLLDLALCVATGRPFLKWDSTQGKVLFINLEIHENFIKERLVSLAKAKGTADFGQLYFCNLRGKAGDFDDLLEQISEIIQGEDYSLIILDPIYKAMVGSSENTASGVGRLCNNLEQFVERTGAAMVFAHHFTKGNAASKKSIDRMSGSGVFARDADTIITLTEHAEDGCFAVEMTLRNLPPQPPFVVQWQFPVMIERPDLDPDDLKRGSGEEEDESDEINPFLELITQTPLTTGQWEAAAIDANICSPATFARKKKELVAQGVVKLNKANNTWSMVNAGESQGDSSETETNRCDDAPKPMESQSITTLKT
jgi:hypothetical protein